MSKTLKNYKPKVSIREFGFSFVGKTIEGSKVVSYSPCKNGFTVWLHLEDGRKIFRTRNSK